MTYIFDYQYFGNVNYYFELINSNYYEFNEYDNYQKMSFRNRCRILGANGPIDLSIPVVGGRELKSQMKDVKICYKEDWRGRHFKTLVSCYNRSPWFEYYRPLFEDLYELKSEYLVDWDMECHNLTLNLLKINNLKNYNISAIQGEIQSSGQENRIDLRNKYLSRMPNPFNISIKPYPQVFSDRYGFVPDLSILDLIFCEGSNAFEVLRSSDRPA
jgi:hypothetical protein